MVWIETPSNPLLRIIDLRFVVDAAHKAGALAVVDNTFLSPALQNPIAFGADVVVHSTTKYINGHSDVVGGAVVARDAVVHETLAWWANALGSPARRSTLPRAARPAHAGRACACTTRERGRDRRAAGRAPGGGEGAFSRPGIASRHALAARQQHGFGAMLSFELAGEAEVRAFADGLECFTPAESLGGVESLVAHPATMTTRR